MTQQECGHDGEGHCETLCTSRVSIFHSLSGEEQRQLVKAAGHRHLPAGAVVFREDDPADRILVIHRGSIKLSHYSAEGKEYVLGIIGANDIYGEQRLFSGQNQEVSAVTLEATSYCEIFRRDIEALIIREPMVGIKMLNELGTKYSRASRMQEILSINDAGSRLAGFLLHISRESGSQTLHLSRDTISASINLRTETISRKLKQLADMGLLETKGHKVIRLLHPDGLRTVFEAAE